MNNSQPILDARGREYQAPLPKAPVGEIAFSESVIFQGINFRKFNPDLLIRAKGGFKVYDDMRVDDQVKMCLNLKKQAVLAAGWKIEPASDSAEDVAVADFVTWVFNKMEGSFDKVAWNVMSALDYGFSVNEIVWGLIEQGDHTGKVGIRAIKSKKPHFYSFAVDQFSNLLPDGLIQDGLVGLLKLPVNKFVIYVHQKEWGNWYGVSDLRSAYRSWWSKDNIVKFWNMALERFGMPVVLGKMKSTDSTARIQLEKVLENLQAKTSVVYPEGMFELDLLEPQRKGTGKQDPYSVALQFHDRGIARSILIPDRLVESGEVGSYAQSRTHFDVFLWIIQKLRNDVAEDAIQEQVVRRLVGWNFTNLKELPQFKFNALTEDMKVGYAQAFSEAVKAGAITAVPSDGAHIRESLQFPEADEDEVLGIIEANRPTPKALPPGGETEDEETGEGEKKQMSRNYVKRKTKTRFEGKVDFQAVQSSLDRLEEKFIIDYRGTLIKQRDTLVKFITKKMLADNLTSGVVRELDLAFKSDLRATSKKMFDEGYALGIKDGKSELPKKFVSSRVGVGVRPQAALDYFSAKKDFVVKGINAPLTGETQQILLNSIRIGETVRATTLKIQEAYLPYTTDGDVIVDGKQLTSHRINTIVRTNMSEAYNYGRRAVGEDPDLKDFVIGYQFSEILDERTVEISRFVDGKIIDINHPALNQLSYPLHFNERGLFVYVTVDERPVAFMNEADIGTAIGMKGL